MVTTRGLDVALDGQRCGTLTQTAAGDLRFEYDDEYRADRDSTPLSLSMPLAVATHRRRVVLPFLQGLLPDNGEALRAIGAAYGVSPNNPFALLEHVGADAAGAVQIVPRGVPFSDAAGARDAARPIDDDEVAALLDRVVEQYRDGVPAGGGAGRFSLAGAQPKIALHRLPDGRWAVPLEATPTTHILKPVAGRFRRIDVVEQVTLVAAGLLGNRVATSSLTRIAGRPVFVSERYDRIRTEAGWRRRHQEDLCQALAVPPAKKYQQRDGGPGVADVQRLLAGLPIEADRREAGERFFRALVFNVVAGCTDAHAKNYSLLLHRRRVELAPLYDLLSYAAYWNGDDRLDSAMQVGGEYSLGRISVAGLVASGRRFGIGGDDAEAIVEETRRSMVDGFARSAALLGAIDDEAGRIAEELVAGVARLPLVRDTR
ncbi:HipA domain-containing protein [uncultured Amnibacterium sp.]|uniref:HipA domain-containing protein n=1 Tax=uncultured Amnibacterium sp. TaxID=1631851 RepID=UPI0035C9652B